MSMYILTIPFRSQEYDAVCGFVIPLRKYQASQVMRKQIKWKYKYCGHNFSDFPGNFEAITIR